jgi:hypothetical protein
VSWGIQEDIVRTAAAVLSGLLVGLLIGFTLVVTRGSEGGDRRDSRAAELYSRAAVASFEYWDEAASLEEARHLFRDDAEMLARIEQTPDFAPLSYRTTLADVDRVEAGRIAYQLDEWPGVLEAVVDAGFEKETSSASRGPPSGWSATRGGQQGSTVSTHLTPGAQDHPAAGGPIAPMEAR